MLHEIRYAIRSLASARGFSTIAIVTLACGIGATTAIFSVVDKVLLRPLGYPDSDRLVQLVLTFKGNGPYRNLSIPELASFYEQKEALEDVTAYDFEGPGFNLTQGDRPEQLAGIHVSANYFRLFGAPIIAGRTFSSEEDLPGAGHFVVLSETLARRQFGSAQDAAGKTLSLGNEPYLIVGVVEATFVSKPAADLWMPLQLNMNDPSQAHYLRGAARLRQAISFRRANQRLELTTLDFRHRFPLFNANVSLAVMPLRDSIIGDVRTALFVLLGAVLFLLLIACANIANLLIVRGAARQREIAIRVAVGATRQDVVLYLLAESLLLSLIGGAFGVVLGQVGIGALLQLSPQSIPRLSDQSTLALDGRILLFAIMLSLVTSVVCGLFPALTVSRASLIAAIRENSAGAGASRGQQRVKAALVIIEFTLAFILLAGAALMIRTFTALRAVNPGFDGRNVLTMKMALSGAKFESTASVTRVIREGERRLMAVPGIEAVAASEMLPLEGAYSSRVTVVGRPSSGSELPDIAGLWPVSPGFFGAFRLPLLSGRLFTEQDNQHSPRVTIISEAFAKKYWPHGNPIGEYLDMDRNVSTTFGSPAREIIGVVGDVRDFNLHEEPRPMMYVALAQTNDGLTALNNRLSPLTWIIRTRDQPYSLIEPVQRELRIASGGLSVGKIRSMETVTSESTARSDFNTALLVIFAAIAVGLAAIGIFGLMSYSVQQSFREIGIRMALGAAPDAVRKMILLRGVKLIGIGIVAGLGGALALGRVMSSLVYGVKPSDPRMLGAAVIVLGAIGLLALYVPARRATRINPMESLRFE